MGLLKRFMSYIRLKKQQKKWSKRESTTEQAGTNTGIMIDMIATVAKAILAGLGPKDTDDVVSHISSPMIKSFKK